MLVQVAALAIPELRPYAKDLGGILFALAGVGILGITLEDSVRAWTEKGGGTLQDDLATVVTEIVTSVLEGQQKSDTQPITKG